MRTFRNFRKVGCILYMIYAYFLKEIPLTSYSNFNIKFTEKNVLIPAYRKIPKELFYWFEFQLNCPWYIPTQGRHTVKILVWKISVEKRVIFWEQTGVRSQFTHVFSTNSTSIYTGMAAPPKARRFRPAIRKKACVSSQPFWKRLPTTYITRKIWG